MGSTPAPGTYSGSQVSAIIGLNQYKTQTEAWQEICEELEPGFNASKGYRFPEKPDNASIRWGHAFEPANIKLSEERDNLVIKDLEKLYTKKIDDIVLSCHIDGNAYKKTDSAGFFGMFSHVHEGKTTNALAYNQKVDERDRWGTSGTDEVPEEYQVQCAVQRICTGADLVKLSVLVFPKAVDEFEAEGWKIENNNDFFQIIKYIDDEKTDWSLPIEWAVSLEQMGYFHTYNLPTNEKLEQAIITAIREFHERYVLTGLPPEPTNYDDIRRLMTRPMGTIIATPDLAEICSDYSEVTRQLGAAGPLKKRKEELRLDILSRAQKLRRANWNEPDDKLIIISSDGGRSLATFGLDKNGNQYFRGAKAG